jgi:hypothetical protein
MGTNREQIEHLEHELSKDSDKPWKKYSYSRKWLKRQMNRFMRRMKLDKRQFKGWEY